MKKANPIASGLAVFIPAVRMKFGSPDSRRSTSMNLSSKLSETKWVSVST